MIIDNIDASSKTRNHWRLCSLNQVEEVKLVLRLITIWFSCIMFTFVQAQLHTYYTIQGSTMINRTLTYSPRITSSLCRHHSLIRRYILWLNFCPNSQKNEKIYRTPIRHYSPQYMIKCQKHWEVWELQHMLVWLELEASWAMLLCLLCMKLGEGMVINGLVTILIVHTLITTTRF